MRIVWCLTLVLGASLAWAGDFSEYRLRAVQEDGGASCMLDGVELHAAEVPPREEGWAPEIYFWFETDPENMSCAKGQNPSVHVFSADLKPLLSVWLTEEDRYCRELYFNPGATRVVMETGTSAVGQYVLRDVSSGDSLFEYFGQGECFWLGPHRFVFTRYEDSPRGMPVEADGRFSVEVYDPAGPGSFSVKAATSLSDYTLKDVEGDEIVIEEQYVDTPEDWKDLEKIKTREIRVPVPAAG